MKLQDITEEAIAWLKVPSVHLFKNWHNYAKIARLIGRENFQPWQEGEWGESDKTDFDHESGYRLRQDYQKPKHIGAGFFSGLAYRLKPHIVIEWVEPQKCLECSEHLQKIAELDEHVAELLEDWRGTLKGFFQHVHETAINHGWHDEPKENGTLIALMHSELSEALEADRKNLQSEHIPDFLGIEEELADVIIRIADFNEAKGLRVIEAMIAKAEYNKGRDYKHGGKKY